MLDTEVMQHLKIRYWWGNWWNNNEQLCIMSLKLHFPGKCELGGLLVNQEK